MYSQTYSLVGETLDNRLLDSYREGLSDASELSVRSSEEFLQTFEQYHFEPTKVTEKFTQLATSSSEIGDIYMSLYKYSYANSNMVCVKRESVSEYMTWPSISNYLEEVYDRIFSIIDNADSYEVSNTKLQQRLESLARKLYVFANMTRTSMLTRFTIKTEDNPTFVFVEMPEELHEEVYPIWYLANSLGVLPPLEKPLASEYTPPEELPEFIHSITLPTLEELSALAEEQDRFVTTQITPTTAQEPKTPDVVFSMLQKEPQRTHRYTQKLIEAYHKLLSTDPSAPLAAD